MKNIKKKLERKYQTEKNISKLDSKNILNSFDSLFEERKSIKQRNCEINNLNDKEDKGPLEIHTTLWTNKFYTNLLIYYRLNRHFIAKVSPRVWIHSIIQIIISHEVLTSN